MSYYIKKSASVILLLTLILVATLPASAFRPVTVPAGTVIPLRMETYLGSDSSKVGDRFTAIVTREVIVDGQVAIPANVKIEGHVTGTTRAERSSRAGTIAVAFDRIMMPDGSTVPIDGTLTTLNEEGRRQIDRDIDEESRVRGGSTTRRNVVFIGGGAGAGAVIGAITGGAKGAAVGAGLGAVLGTIGVLVSKGEKAEVQPGTEFGLLVERPLTVDVESSGVPGDRFDQDQANLSSIDSIRQAQMVLRDRGFYRGPINGDLTFETRSAIRNFQRDRNLTATGDLDFRTARELGITGQGRPGTGTGPGTGQGTGIGNARQIAFLANRLLQDYMRELNIRGTRGQVTFDSRRNLTQDEVELLFQLDALQSAAQLYGQIAPNVSDPNALKGAAESLIRQLRLTNRVIRRNPNMRLSSVVTNDWEQLRTEIRNITLTDNNLDSDIIR